jgi:ribosomal-protein-serine acetyltransferase
MVYFTLSDTLKVKIMELRYSDKYYDFIEINKDRLIDWIPFVSSVKSKEDSDNYLRKYLDKFGKGTGGLYGIWEEKKLVCVLAVVDINQDTKVAELGYMTDKNSTGKGITKNGCKAVINYLFNDLVLDKIELCCNDNNVESYKLAESLGFKLEGTIRKHIKVNHKIADMRYYGLLKEEWK